MSWDGGPPNVIDSDDPEWCADCRQKHSKCQCEPAPDEQRAARVRADLEAAIDRLKAHHNHPRDLGAC